MEISMANEIENSIIVPQNEDFARPNQPFQTQIQSEFSHPFCEEGRSRKPSKSNVVGDD